MPLALTIRTDFSPDQLEAIAAGVEDKSQARRLRAIAAILKGASRHEAAAIGGMQRQTLRDWVQRFNMEGPAGLVSRRPSGRPAKLSPGQKRDLMAFLFSETAKEPYQVIRWRLADIVEIVKRRYGVELNEISVGRILRSAGLVYNGAGWLRSDLAHSAIENSNRSIRNYSHERQKETVS